MFLLNTEFFFDSEVPHGNIVGPSIKVPTPDEYDVKARSIANFIDKYQANLVALVEVENRDCVELVQENLNHKEFWQIIFLEGRDTFTGQDVVLLSKFPVIKETITNFPDQWSNCTYQGKSKSVRPSKVLGCELSIHGPSVYLIVIHLISKRFDNDAKRLGQAKVLRQQSIRALEKDQNVILVGDFNDTPNTPVLQELRGKLDKWAESIQTAENIPLSNRYTYVYQSQKQLLDHIPLSSSLQDEFLSVPVERRCQIFDTKNLSDHKGMIVRLKLNDF